MENTIECCSSAMIKDYQTGAVICKNCGKVIELTSFDRGPEWTREHERKRGCLPPSYAIHDKGLTTQIDYRNRDAKGKQISPSQRARAYRLRKWQKRARVSDGSNRRLAKALGEISRITSVLGLPPYIKEEISLIYRDAARKDLIRGHKTEEVTAAICYIACRKFHISRSFAEIEEATQIPKKKIVKSFISLCQKLDISLPLAEPSDYMSRYCSELGMSSAIQMKAIELLKEIKNKKLDKGKNPITTVAAVLYIASLLVEERKSQQEIAEVTHTSTVGIRHRYQELSKKLNLEVK